MNPQRNPSAPAAARRAPAASSTKAVQLIPAPPPSSRQDGWTLQRQGAFLRALAATHSVVAAARAVGMSRQTAYRLRVRLKGEPFDLAWDAAFHCSFDALAQSAMERALNGVEVPHYHQGELVGTSRRYDERLTIALLRMREQFLRAPPPPFHDSSAYEPDDFRGLLARVEQGPATWDGAEPEGGEWDADEDLPEEGEAAGAV